MLMIFLEKLVLVVVGSGVYSRARSARSARSVAPLLYEIEVTIKPKKFGRATVRPTVKGATFSMHGQLYHGHYLSHYVMEGRGRR